MQLHELREKIDRKEARLAVIGLGYVGLPVACEFARVGFDVLGVEILQERVNKINAGVTPIDGYEPGLEELIKKVIDAGNFRATRDYHDLQDCDVFIVAVETPIDENNFPHYEALRAALQSLSPILKTGALVIIESTIAPGTMKEEVLPLLSQNDQRVLNKDFFLGNCPERVMPGKLLTNLRGMNRVVGGMTPDTAQVMIALYKHIVEAELDATDCITAELVKTVENAYRDVQIAFANEVALICEAVGGDVWKVRQLVNKSPFRQMHLPGAGVGGHCIPKDPWLLAHGVKEKPVPLRLIPAARAVNDFMPHHMAELVRKALETAGRQIAGVRVLVMGYAYLEESDDTRNSPSEILVHHLRELGAEVVVHDPYVPGYQGDLLTMASGCEVAVVMVRHREYQQIDLRRLRNALNLPVLVDGRGVYNPEQACEAGMDYWGIGSGKQTR